MTKSRIALLFALAVPAAAWGQLPIAPAGEWSAQAEGIGNCPPVTAQANGIGNCPHATAEDAMAAGQAIVRQSVRPGCAEGDEEIVVCGRRDDNDQHRLPLRVEPEPRAADRAGGEQMAAVQVDTSPCTTVGQNPRCSGGLPVIPIALWALEVLAKAVAGDD